MTTIISIVIESGKNKKTKVSAHHQGKDGIIYFRDGSKIDRASELASAIGKIIQKELK